MYDLCDFCPSHSFIPNNFWSPLPPKDSCSLHLQMMCFERVELIWCDISPPHRSRVGPGHTVFLFAAAHADNLPGMEACHKDLAQGVWENSSGVFQAQTPALMTSNKYEHLFLWKRCIRLFAWPSVSFGFGCGFSLPNSQQCCLESCLRISWIIRLTRSL